MNPVVVFFLVRTPAFVLSILSVWLLHTPHLHTHTHAPTHTHAHTHTHTGIWHLEYFSSFFWKLAIHAHSHPHPYTNSCTHTLRHTHTHTHTHTQTQTHIDTYAHSNTLPWPRWYNISDLTKCRGSLLEASALKFLFWFALLSWPWCIGGSTHVSFFQLVQV